MEKGRAAELAAQANDVVRKFMQDMRAIAVEARGLDKDEQQTEIERLVRLNRKLSMQLRVERKKVKRLVGRLRKYAPEDADAFENIEPIGGEDA